MRPEGSSFPGSRVNPDDPRYPTLIRGFNQRWVGHPQYVEVVGDAGQIVEVVQRCVDDGLRPTVRSGGHCYEGWVSLNDGVILDVSSMHAAGREPETGWYFLGTTVSSSSGTVRRTVHMRACLRSFT